MGVPTDEPMKSDVLWMFTREATLEPHFSVTRSPGRSHLSTQAKSPPDWEERAVVYRWEDDWTF